MSRRCFKGYYIRNVSPERSWFPTINSEIQHVWSSGSRVRRVYETIPESSSTTRGNRNAVCVSLSTVTVHTLSWRSYRVYLGAHDEQLQPKHWVLACKTSSLWSAATEAMPLDWLLIGWHASGATANRMTCLAMQYTLNAWWRKNSADLGYVNCKCLLLCKHWVSNGKRALPNVNFECLMGNKLFQM